MFGKSRVGTLNGTQATRPAFFFADRISSKRSTEPSHYQKTYIRGNRSSTAVFYRAEHSLFMLFAKACPQNFQMFRQYHSIRMISPSNIYLRKIQVRILRRKIDQDENKNNQLEQKHVIRTSNG